MLGIRRPYAATVEFPSSLSDDQRKKAFAVNTKCLVRPGGCKTAEAIVPGISATGIDRKSRLNTPEARVKDPQAVESMSTPVPLGYSVFAGKNVRLMNKRTNSF